MQSISARLRSHLRSNDTVARLGGDEFALILEDIVEVPALLERCQHLCDMLAMPYPLDNHQDGLVARISASIGIALWSGDAQSDEQLIQAADRALYQAKDAGKNRCVLTIEAPDLPA